MTRLPLILALAMATPAFAEPNDLIPDSAFIIGFTDHAGGSSRVQTGWTDDAVRVYGPRWDEGWGIRGGGLTWETTYGDVSVSAYKNSLIDGGNGYSVSYSTPAFLAADVGAGVLSAHGVSQLNFYPQQAKTYLEESNGWFPSFGVSMRYEHSSGAGAFMTVYPSFGYDKSFTHLYVAGVSFRF